MGVVSGSTTKDSWLSLVEEALHNIEQSGGTPIDADIILAHFGLIGDWVSPMIEKIRAGLGTVIDVLLIKEQLNRFAR